jgi:ribose 1,5-bisphosphokinase
MSEGRLFYVIGPSGSGKDSLLRHARERLAAQPGMAPCVVFAHRYITRPVESGGENHIALSEAEFDARLSANLFAMHWAGNGLRYGIGREINLWLAKSCNVVMNGSRAYLPQARQRYPDLAAILVTVAPAVLAARLRARGRESEAQIAQRIARAEALARPAPPLHVIHNDGALADAGEQLLELLTPMEMT